MKPLLAICIYLSALMLFSACSQESGTILAEKDLPNNDVEVQQHPNVPAQQFQWITEDGGQSQLDFNPRVDVLFVTDNSDSMKSAQENLVKNLNRFTNGITSNKMIDYHIGVTSVWENTDRFINAQKDSFQNGDLRFVKNAKGQVSTRRYVTKDDSSSILAATLNIGVVPFEQGGPQYEEFFSPLTAALQKTGRGAVNEGFFRDDAQLVVIVMTDADEADKSQTTAEEMAKTLIDFKGGDSNKVSVYGVLVSAKDPDEYKDWDLRIHPKYHPECFDMTKKTPKLNGTCTTGFGPNKLIEFITKANVKATPDEISKKYIMSIISKDFGTDLASIGDSITIKTLEKEIFLSQRPRFENGQYLVRVRYGTPEVLAAGKGQLIQAKISGKTTSGWVYDVSRRSVQLSGNIKYQYQDGARFAVDLSPEVL